MMDQSVSFRLARVQHLLQGVEDEVGPHLAADAPADDTPGEGVDDEGHVDEALPRRDIREIADPQLVWPLRLGQRTQGVTPLRPNHAKST